MDLIDREQALGCFWNYANDDGSGYDETEMPAYDRLQALPIVKEVDDCISRQAVIDLWDKYHPYISIKAMAYDRELRALPPAEPEVREIGYIECANAMLKMWIDNVLTDGEYNRIMDKLNEYWGKVNA